MSSQFSLLKSRRFAPFFLTQFFGAFNDNVVKNAMVVLITFQASSWTTMSAGLLANMAAGLFMLPFFLFSASAGQLADKYDKARLARLVKVLEIGVVSVAGLGFALHSLSWLMAALFLLGCHSTLFGPVKYAILPQHLKPGELIGGNALVEAGTFAAILTGTIAGGLLAGMKDGTVWITAFSLVVAVLGYISSRFIPPGPAPVPQLQINLNPLVETWRNIGFARKNKAVFLAIIGISWFWLYGALFLAQFPAYAKSVLGGGETAVTLLLATFTIGIALGSLLCEKLSRHQVEIGLVPFGALGLTLFGLDFAWSSSSLTQAAEPLSVMQLLSQGSTWRILADLLGLGLFGGFYCVPLYAQMQQESDVNFRARVIAANNIINALFMVAGAGGAAALLGQGLSLPALFAYAATANFIVVAALFMAAPVFMTRCASWLGLAKG